MHTGKPMETNQSNGQTDTQMQPHVPLDDSAHDFGRRNPLEIGVQLRNLVNRGDFLTVQYAGGQLVTRLLDVDVRGRTFTFDWGALARIRTAACSPPRAASFTRRPRACAWSSAQARRAKRVSKDCPHSKPTFRKCCSMCNAASISASTHRFSIRYVCTGRLPEGDSFRFEVHDLSLGGVGMRTADERVAELPMGTRLDDCELVLGSLGRLSLDLQLVSHRSLALPNGTQRYQLGFRF